MQFIPVPYAALGLVTPSEYRALVDLYHRAHRLRWKPFNVTAASLATSWECSTRRVWDVLRALEAAGLLTLKPGSNRLPSVITVFDPTEKPDDEQADALNHKVSRNLNHKVSRNDDGSTQHIGEPEPQGESQGESQVVRVLGDPELEPEPDPEEHTGPPAEPVLVSPVEPPAKPDPWQELAAHYGSLPFCRPPQKRHLGNGAHLSKLIKALGLVDAKLVLDWWAYADDERARFLRDGSAEERAGRSVLEKRPPKYGLETIARPGKLEGYHERALAWQAGGRRQRRPDGVHGAGYSAAPPEAPDRLTDPDGYAAWVADDIPF